MTSVIDSSKPSIVLAPSMVMITIAIIDSVMLTQRNDSTVVTMVFMSAEFMSMFMSAVFISMFMSAVFISMFMSAVFIYMFMAMSMSISKTKLKINIWLMGLRTMLMTRSNQLIYVRSYTQRFLSFSSLDGIDRGIAIIGHSGI